MKVNNYEVEIYFLNNTQDMPNVYYVDAKNEREAIHTALSFIDSQESDSIYGIECHKVTSYKLNTNI